MVKLKVGKHHTVVWACAMGVPLVTVFEEPLKRLAPWTDTTRAEIEKLVTSLIDMLRQLDAENDRG